ncbi:MAG TPA: hypothetical protein VLM79_16415 [Kofleriaceae bacterium]|nr:hypothetical protein [Kofleriaceae bacterium]
MMPSITLALWTVGVGIVCVAAMRRRIEPQRSLATASRLAAIALVVEATVVLGSDQLGDAGPLALAILVAILVLDLVVLASLSVIALRAGPGWAAVGAVLLLVGWAARTPDLCWAIATMAAWIRQAPLPSEISQLDGAAVQLIGIVGGLLTCGALASTIEDCRTRRWAWALLVCHAVFGVLGVIVAHQMRMSAQLERVVALRWQRGVTDAAASVAMAGVLWRYWHWATHSQLPRAIGRPRS